MPVTVFAKEIAPILKNTDLHSIRNGHELSIHFIAGQQLWIKRGDFVGQLVSKVNQVLPEQSRPNHIDVEYIDVMLLQKLARQIQLLQSCFWNREIAKVDSCLTRK